MNFNIAVICNTCGEQTNCRLGMSNRSVQPLRFRCNDCGSPIDITITPDFETICVDIEVLGAEQIKVDAFKKGVNFVDLHLDFPVAFGEYVMGLTPFMAASMRIGLKEMQIHSSRVNFLNKIHDRSREIKAIFTLYTKEKNDLFKTKVLEFIGSDLECETQLDINRALYLAIEKAFFPFSEPERNVNAVKAFTEELIKCEIKDDNSLNVFFDEIISNGFLKNVQMDCLEIYPRIIDVELMFRPALFLDFEKNNESTKIPYRVSAHEFSEVKDLYKDIAEIISRLLVLVAGLNNIDKRNSHNKFKDTNGSPKSLNDFANFPLGKKLDFIDDCWYEFENDVLDNQLRNSVAHYKAEYNEITQEVVYFPKQEGMRQEKPKNMYFLDFSRRVLLAFRELHRLNHLTKCLFVYYYLKILRVKGTPFF